MFFKNERIDNLGDIKIKTPTNNEFDLLCHLAAEFDLDTREMKKNQFLVAVDNDVLIGFGRIIQHPECREFCTLGIVEHDRNKGVGSKLIKEIIKKATQPFYLACIIPRYFESFGFRIVSEFPKEMQTKLDYCNDALSVNDTYVVMQLHASANLNAVLT